VVLAGDSHATAWRGALFGVARQLNWQVVQLLKGACPVTDAPVVGFRGSLSDPATVEECRRWSRAADAEIRRLAPDYVFTSGYAGDELFDRRADRSVETGARGFATAWTRWAAGGSRVFVLRDVPSTGDVRVPDCLAVHPGDPVACARPRNQAVVPDAITVAAGRAASDRVRLVDLTDHFCDAARCYAVVGGAQVYFDGDHMTGQFSRSLAPFLLEGIGGGLG
jgi:hypothetical protein